MFPLNWGMEVQFAARAASRPEGLTSFNIGMLS